MPATVTRFPPSPTGALHLGGARTALFNWLHAKKHGGEMVLRMEDTDRARSSGEAADGIIEALRWLGLDWGRGPYYQSERGERYREVVRQLLDSGNAYYCFCSRETLDAAREAARAAGKKPRYDGKCRDKNRAPKPGETAAVRFKNPLDGAVVFADAVRGRVSIENAELDDLILARSDGAPTYHLCAVADDIDMGVTHIIRGDDHTNNTPRQINIFRALGANLPQFAHLPMICGADGKRLSKRHGAADVLDYRARGFLPEALLNYLARLGWASGDREIFSREELIESFDIAGVNKAAAAFDEAKLLWLNRHYIRAAPAERLAEELRARLGARGINTDVQDAPPPGDVAEALRERAQTLEELADKAACFYAEIEYDPAAAKKHLVAPAGELLGALGEELARIAEWDAAAIGAVFAQVAEAHSVKLGKLAQPARVAACGGAATPPIDITFKLIGKTRALARLRAAREWIAAHDESHDE
ncbi:MAG: glutamate--tRNA ligase [Gammaproteobacteria bacterium]|nr:glutamate--tRNA ligase [Gammaproteobacteria bacterium]